MKHQSRILNAKNESHLFIFPLEFIQTKFLTHQVVLTAWISLTLSLIHEYGKRT